MYARHSLVWLSDAGWRAVAACGTTGLGARSQAVAPTAADSSTASDWSAASDSSAASDARALCDAPAEAIARWRANDWPLIVRRADADLSDGQISLGLALPPHPRHGTKLRIALRADVVGIRRISEALPIAQCRSALPEPWRDGLTALDREACALGLNVRVFGSLAMQALTGQRYLTPTSDIDLLVAPASAMQLDRLVALLDGFGTSLPLDGEIVFGDGLAVAWKECMRAMRGPAGARVLAKGPRDVSLRKLSDLIDTLQAEECAR